MTKLLPAAISVLVVFLFVVFGLNFFLQFMSMPPPTDPTVQTFFGAMVGTYLGKFVGFTQVLAGVLLLVPRTRFLGTLVLLPITANILLFHLSHDFPGSPIWMVFILLHLALLYFHRDNLNVLMILPGTAANQA